MNTDSLIICFYFIVFILNVIVTTFAIPQIIFLDIRKQLHGNNNARSVAQPSRYVSDLGGVAIFCSFIIVISIATTWFKIENWYVVTAVTTLLFFTALRHDLVKQRARSRMLVKLVAIVITLFMTKLKVNSLSGLFGIYAIPDFLGYLTTGLFFLGVMKTIEFFDKIYGLVATVVIPALFIMGITFTILGSYGNGIISFGLVGCLSAFFIYQLKSARISLGRTGQVFIGFLFGYLSLTLLNLFQSEGQMTPSLVVRLVANIPMVISFTLIALLDLSRRIMHWLIYKTPFSIQESILGMLLSKGLSPIRIAFFIGAINIIVIAIILFCKYINMNINGIIAIMSMLICTILWYTSRYFNDRFTIK